MSNEMNSSRAAPCNSWCSLRSIMGSRVRLGLATVREPRISSPSRRGAATCITELAGSSGSLRVLRAPYSPRKVR